LKEYLKDGNQKSASLNRKQFGDLLARSQLATDPNMVDKLFWYFSER